MNADMRVASTTARVGRFAPLALVGLLALAGCATVPSGPSVMVLPGSTKTFDQFRADDAGCRQYALAQVGGVSAEFAMTDSTARSAALGTAVGAVAGAAIDGSHGAAAGAATGLLFGTLAGTGVGSVSAYEAQRRYDHAFVQCMYASGHRVPVYGELIQSNQRAPVAPAPAYPPPGTPPPPNAAPPAVRR